MKVRIIVVGTNRKKIAQALRYIAEHEMEYGNDEDVRGFADECDFDLVVFPHSNEIVKNDFKGLTGLRGKFVE